MRVATKYKFGYHGAMTKAMLQEKKITEIARRQVAAALREILSDPDAGLVLRASAAQRLKKSIRSKEEGKVKNLSRIIAKYS